MSKKKRRPGSRPNEHASPTVPAPWLDSDGLHALLPGHTPSHAALDEMTRLYRQSARSSPLWDEMVREFGEEAAERMLQEFRVEVR